MKIIFDTERLRVRMYEPYDEEKVYSVGGDEEIMRYIRPVKTREESNEFLKMILKNYTENTVMGRWCVQLKASNEFVGSFAILKMENNPKIEVGYLLLKKWWGMGFASELVEAGKLYAKNVLNIDTLYAVTFPPNLASQKVLLRTGFINEGTINEHGGENLLFSYKF